MQYPQDSAAYFSKLLSYWLAGWRQRHAAKWLHSSLFDAAMRPEVAAYIQHIYFKTKIDPISGPPF